MSSTSMAAPQFVDQAGRRCYVSSAAEALRVVAEAALQLAGLQVFRIEFWFGSDHDLARVEG